MRRQGLLILIVAGIGLAGVPPAIGAAVAEALTFAPPVHYALGGKPADLASADLNGDGRPDLVASAGAGIDVLLGRQGGRLAPATRIPLKHRPGALALADLNSDGTQDVVTANRDGTVTVLLGDGAGAFVAKGTFPTGPDPTDVVVGDLTGDGIPDVATANGAYVTNGGGLKILPGDGTGGLLTQLDVPVDEGCTRLVTGDFDLDGVPDLAYTRYSWLDYGGFSVQLGNGLGGFSPPVPYDLFGSDNGLGGLALTDLNGDHRPDLVARQCDEGTCQIGGLLGDGLGAFSLASSVVISQDLDASGLATGDLNQDGRADVVTAGRSSGYITDSVKVPPGPPRIYIMISAVKDGTFRKTQSFPAGRLPGQIVVADFNLDGRPDLATTEAKAKSLSVRMRGTLPVLTGVSPAHVRVGDTVTLTGRHFGKTGVVRFGAVTVSAYLSRSDSLIKLRVPRGTARGRVKVTVTTLVGRCAPRWFFRL